MQERDPTCVDKNQDGVLDQLAGRLIKVSLLLISDKNGKNVDA